MLKSKVINKSLIEQVAAYKATKLAYVAAVKANMAANRPINSIEVNALHEAHLAAKACLDTELDLIIEVLEAVVAGEYDLAA